MSLKRIRLELARTNDHPNGSHHCGYEFLAPLDSHGHFEAEAWKSVKDRCKVYRFWEGEDGAHGKLVHTKGRRWIFDYDAARNEDDEPIFRFEDHVFATGSYVSITEHDGVTRPFRVASVKFED